MACTGSVIAGEVVVPTVAGEIPAPATPPKKQTVHPRTAGEGVGSPRGLVGARTAIGSDLGHRKAIGEVV